MLRQGVVLSFNIRTRPALSPHRLPAYPSNPEDDGEWEDVPTDEEDEIDWS